MRSAFRWIPSLGLAALLCAAAPAAKPRGNSSRPPDTMSDLQSSVKRLADPKWEGRGVGTAGIDSAAVWIADQMKRMGLQPGGDDGTYFQDMEVTTGVKVGDPCAVEVKGKRFALGESMQPIGFSTNGTLEAPVVFAGYGITAPGFDYDDYAGLDVHDKVVLVMSNEPGEMDSTSRFDGSVNTPHSELRTKAINAREHGALGIVVVDGPRYHAGEAIRPPGSEGYMSGGLLAARVSQPVADALFDGSGMTLAKAQEAIDAHTKPHSMALPAPARLTVTLQRTRAHTKNVVGMITGRDTSRTLVIGAHYDHLGYGGESSLAPDLHVPHVGADDNASGTAALLSIASREAGRAKSGKPPIHDLVFCAFTGEEMGLVGSSHFTDQPTRPLESVEAMLNMDMVGRLRKNQLMVMGVGTATDFPDLVQHVNAATERFDLKTSSDGYGPSDHSSFYKKKVPVLMLFTGAHEDYHKPSDTWDKLDYPGLARVARFAGAMVESLDARPRPTYLVAKADSGSVGRIAGGGGYGAYLGTIPDYMQTQGGVLLSGVRSGGPAEKAGLQGGDVIVKFDGIQIDNIYDYTFALRSRKPGQDVRITVKRAGAEKDLVATLGRRP